MPLCSAPAISFVCGLLAAGIGQAAEVRHKGFLEYQYRRFDYQDAPANAVHLATWRADVATWLWQPWILALNGSLGLTATQNARGDSSQGGNLVTGALVANVLPRSPFPFRAFVDSRDSRIESDISALDLRTLSYGFMQQLAPRGGGGRLALEYRHTDSDELYADGARIPRDFSTDHWQLSANKALGRNDLNLLTAVRFTERADTSDSQERQSLSLRHRFRAGPRFFLEDTTFYSDERIELDGMDLARRFAQFNAITTWRPDVGRPLLLTGRALLQGTDSGSSDDMSGAAAAVLTAAASYQWSPNFTLSGNVGAVRNDRDTAEAEDRYFQRLRTTYRADDTDFLGAAYRWSVTAEAANVRESTASESVRDVGASLEHGLTRTVFARDRYQLQLSLSQQLSTLYTTGHGRERGVLNSAFATFTHHGDQSTSYLRLSATDRRLYGVRRTKFRLANFQLSTRARVGRNRSLNGSVSLQYSRNDIPDDVFFATDNRALSYSANLSFSQRELFAVQRLNLLSEIRWLSSDFQSEDPFDRDFERDTEREDRVWRNRLDYRVGRLEFRLTADLREINGGRSGQVFLQIRRYYGEF